MQVDYEDLSLAGATLSRQGTEHLSTMEQFIEQWARIDSADLGDLLKALKPINDAVVELGKLTVRQLGEAHEWTGKKLDATLDTYVETDRQVYEEAARILRERGHTVPPFTDPRTYLPGLGAAARAAGPGYGGGKPSVIEQVYGSGEALRRYDEDQFYRAENRYAQAKSANRGIEEAQDASSYLVPPEPPTSEIDNMRWSAGVLLGSVDWVFEQLFGWSLLNDLIYKPFAGDWRVVDGASTAWSYVDKALVAIGENDSAVLPALSEWTGDGSEACNAFITALSGATTALSYAAGYVSGIVGKVATVAKLAAWAVGEALKTISNLLCKLALNATVPVAGWIKAGADIALSLNEILSCVRAINLVLNLIYEAIAGVVQAKAKIVEVSYTVINIGEAAVRGTGVRA